MSSILALLQTPDAMISLIAGVLSKFAALVKEEDDYLDQLKHYETTQEIHDEDSRRDNAFYQIFSVVRVGLRHFDESKREAAERVNNIMRDFKGVPKLPLAEESAAIHNLLQKLETVSADIASLGLNEWVSEMKDANTNVRALMAERESEAAYRTQHSVKTARAAVDEAYSELLVCLEAAAIVDNSDACKQMLAEINARIDEYNNVLSREKGWRNSRKSEEEGIDN
ncbi:MAG: DUF6261 family protein [Planctomycetaceae bacterium]|nr:DUF6261 family protein [Planctomycetaceae bacterium]